MPESWPGAISPRHMQALARAAIPTIDIVVVNLYPFAQTVARPDCTLEEAIENIDIGGPTMVRAAAKNYQHVSIVTDPQDYGEVLAELDGLRRGVEPGARGCAWRARPSRIPQPTTAPSATT